MPDVSINITFDQNVINFTSSDVTVTENLPGAFSPGSITNFVTISASEYELTWTHNDDGSGGSIDFTISAGVCNGSVGNIPNVASSTLNAPVMAN